MDQSKETYYKRHEAAYRNHVTVFHHEGAEYIFYIPMERAPTTEEIEALTISFESLIDQYWTGESHGEDGYIDDDIISELLYLEVEKLKIHATTWGGTEDRSALLNGGHPFIKPDHTIVGPDNTLPRTTIVI
jgi:hypothetical protein